MSPRFAPFVDRVAHEGADPWALHWEARQALAAGRDVIVLSVGDPDLDTPPRVIDAAVASLRAGDTHYTESAGRPQLRTAIAARHAARTGQTVTAENVIVLSGTQNGLFVASLCLAGPGDEVIALDPMYATYPATIRASGATLVRVPMPAAANFHTDVEALEAAVTPRTRAIFVATPNNPSGVILSEAEVESLAAIARRHDLWIVSDEVYAGLADGGRVPSLGAQLPEQVLTVASLSKTHAMTGWRAGWIVGPKSFVHHADELAQCMLYGLPGFVQEAAVTALAIAAESEAAVRDYCRRRRELLYAELSGIAGIRPCWPDAGMFMLLDVRATGLAADDFVRRLFKAEGVSLLDGAVFGRETEGFVRACYAAEEPVLREAALRIRRFCQSLAPAR
jgi:aspartate/methionine/tyrosine aminotransferase